jgi:hypothetical protein
MTEGSWSMVAGACGTRVVSVQYNWWQDGATGVGGGTFPGASGGTTPQLKTTSSEVGHAITGQVTACDNLDDCTTENPGGFAPTSHTPTDTQIGVNSSTGATVCNSATAPYDLAGNSKWARLFVNWSAYEPNAPDADHDAYTGDADHDDWSTSFLSTVASCIQVLHASGHESVLVDFISTPSWAQNAGEVARWGPPANQQTCANEGCYGLAAANLVSDPSIVAAGGIQAVEVWNEENDAGPDKIPATGDEPFWTGTEAQYETLLQGAYQQLHPLGVTVVTGGTIKNGSLSWDDTLMNAEQAPHSQVACSTGVNWPQGPYCFDALGAHTYAEDNQHTILQPYPQYQNGYNAPDIPNILNGSGNDTLTNLVNDLNSHGLNTTPIWITEMGALASPTNWLNDVQNANMLTYFFEYIGGTAVEGEAACPTATCSRIHVGMWFTDNLPPSSQGYDYNLLNPTLIPLDTTLIPKPEYAAFVNLP